MSDVIDVEVEVAVRKYEVNVLGLQNLLKSAKGKRTCQEIADELNRPKTEVDHWFRQDKYFAVPSADIWFSLKALLGIETDEFDASITEFEYKGGNYDMRNRIYTGDVAPTLIADGSNRYHILPKAYTLKVRGGVEIDSYGKRAGKGALVQEELCGTIGVSQDQYLFQPVSYDARGNGAGGVVNTMTGDHNNRITDYTSLVIEPICMATQQGGGRDNEKQMSYDNGISRNER